MNKQIEESKSSALLSFLSYLIKETIYPYGYQVPGHYKAEKLKEKICNCFHNGILKVEDLQNKNGRLIEKDILLKEVSNEICSIVSQDLEGYFLMNSNNFFYLIDYRIFSKDVFEKIIQILR